MDIERAEYEAMLGSKAIFQFHRVKVFALELHPHQLLRRKKSILDISEFLENCGYELISGQGNSVWEVSKRNRRHRCC